MESLPQLIRNNNFFLRRWADKIKLKNSCKEAQENISSLRKHPRFSVDKAIFVKFLSQFMCNQGANLCVFFADCDNLRIANEIANKKAEEINLENANKKNMTDISCLETPITGEEIVDRDIESILLQIKNINKKYRYEDSLVGINGDEIFITIPNLKPEDLTKIYEEYKKAKSGLITISVGYSNDTSNGIYDAFNKAEKLSQKEKQKKKMRYRKDIFKENHTEILADELKAMLLQLRIHVDELSKEQKEFLKNNISSSFETILKTPQGIFQDVHSILFSSESGNFIKQQIIMLERTLENTYTCSITPEEKKDLILSQILSKSPVDGIEKIDYFLQKQALNLISADKKRTYSKLNNQALVSIELSGIKDINDTYGHSECDKMVFNTMSQFKDLTTRLCIKKASPIFEYNISSYGFLVPVSEIPKIDELSSYIFLLDSEFKIAISCNRLRENINLNTLNSYLNNQEKNSFDILTFLLDSANSVNKEKNKKINSINKIKDKKSIARYISRNLKRITHSLGKEPDLETIENALNQVLNLAPSVHETQKFKNHIETPKISDEKHI